MAFLLSGENIVQNTSILKYRVVIAQCQIDLPKNIFFGYYYGCGIYDDAPPHEDTAQVQRPRAARQTASF
jgi:hypothetical protein